MFVPLMMLGPSPQNRASTALNALLAPDALNPAAYRGIFPEIRQAPLVRNVIHDAALRARALTTALIRGYIPVFLPSRNYWRAKASSIDSGLQRSLRFNTPRNLMKSYFRISSPSQRPTV
jgi:hypothetical protein